MKINTISLTFYFALFFIGNSSLSAQQKDFQCWTDISAKKSLSKNWEIDFEQNIRFGNNAGRLEKSYTNITAAYSVNKILKLDVMYRFVIRNKLDYTSYGHSFAFDASLKQKFNKLQFSLRNRFMLKYTDIRSSELGHIPEKYYRTKLSVDYKTKKFPLDPFVSVESFLLLPVGEKSYFDAFRASAGVEFTLNKQQAITCYWMNEWGYNVKNPEDLYILGISYSYTF